MYGVFQGTTNIQKYILALVIQLIYYYNIGKLYNIIFPCFNNYVNIIN